ncbi:MAG: PD-(D/E)XK nuclease family protein [Elusimicrobiaceae bacterium]|nr:PD-(D/E)XK nuclease family protein [Elusimicrobiaceae bacterium]
MARTKLLDFSYSRMNLYKECPQKYKFRYIHKIPEKPKTYFSFGHSIHASLEFLYRVDAPPFPSLDEVLRVFERDWHTKTPEEKGYSDISREHDDFLHGIKLLTGYYEKHKATLAVPVSVEMFVKLPIDGLNVISVVDRIDYLGDGQLSVVDYKTGKTVVKEPAQLNMYQKVIETSPDVKNLVAAKTGYSGAIKVARMSFYQLENLKENVFDPASVFEIEAFWKEVLAVADNIRAEKFEPTPGEKACRFCDYKNLCPVFASGRLAEPAGPARPGCAAPAVSPSAAPAQAAPAKAEPAFPSDPLTDKVDRYGELFARHEELGRDLDALRTEIIALMNDKEYVQHFGRKYKVRLKTCGNWSFPDRQKVIEFLKETGLLKKVLVPTQTTVEKLLADEAVDEDARAALKKLGRYNRQSHLDCSGIDD